MEKKLKQKRIKAKKMLGAVLAIALTLSGCAAAGTPASSEMSSQTSDVSGNSGTRTVTDFYGRQVEVPAEVKTIAAIGGAARILTYGGCADQLVGVTDMDKKNDVAMPYSVVNADHFQSLTSVGSGGANDTCYTEALVTLHPDVIFGMTDSADTVNRVQQQTGIPTIGLDAENMFDESFYSSLQLVGEVMGTQEHCAQVIDYIKGCQQDLDSRTKDIPKEDKPTVYTGAVSFRGAHGFEGTYGDYPPFTAIHADNVVDQTGQSGALTIDLEKVAAWDPDIIFLNPTNMNLVKQEYKENKAFYGLLKAVKNGSVYTQIAYNYNWTNLEIAIADAYYAGKVIYPNQFSEIDPVAKADEIFSVMLGRPFYDTLEKNGLGFGKINIGE